MQHIYRKFSWFLNKQINQTLSSSFIDIKGIKFVAFTCTLNLNKFIFDKYASILFKLSAVNTRMRKNIIEMILQQWFCK